MQSETTLKESGPFWSEVGLMLEHMCLPSLHIPHLTQIFTCSQLRRELKWLGSFLRTRSRIRVLDSTDENPVVLWLSCKGKLHGEKGRGYFDQIARWLPLSWWEGWNIFRGEEVKGSICTVAFYFLTCVGCIHEFLLCFSLSIGFFPKACHNTIELLLK